MKKTINEMIAKKIMVEASLKESFTRICVIIPPIPVIPSISDPASA